MALKVKWSKYADLSFDRILEYLQAEWGETVSRAFVRSTYEFLDLLAEFPEIGSLEYPDRLTITGKDLRTGKNKV